MEFRKILSLRGPNIWANFPVMEAWVDLGGFKDSSSDELPGFNDRLMAWLPTMIEHRCSPGRRGGFFERLRRGTYLAHILEHVVLELQTLAGTDVGFGRTRETSEDGVYKMAFEYQSEELALVCLHAGRELCLAAVHGSPYDVDAEVGKLRETARRVAPPADLAAVVAAARERKIPWQQLNAAGLLQLGYGAGSRRVLDGQTDRTGAIAQSIADDLELTRTFLQAAGVPVPEGRAVRSAEDAWAAAEEIGLPVVIKPRYGTPDRKNSGMLSNRDEVLAAYQSAAAATQSLVVERFVPGPVWRLVVVGGKVVGAFPRGTAAHLSPLSSFPGANGAASANGNGPHANGQNGQAALGRAGSGNGAPHEGQNGRPHEAVCPDLHPDLVACVTEAAGMIGLDVAAIDVAVSEPRQPLEKQGGAIVAIDPCPGRKLRAGDRPDVLTRFAEALVAELFPDGRNGRIPVVSVTGVNGKTTTTRLIAHVIGLTRRRVGMTCTDGIFIDGRRIDGGDCSGPQSARAVLQNQRVDAAVLETARGGILRAGLGFDRCDVAVVTNIGEGDHLGLADIDTPEKLARVKSTPVGAVAEGGTAVLNAEDPLVADMASCCAGSVLFFAHDGAHPVLVRNRAAGGRAAFVRNGSIVLADGEQEIPLVSLERVPLTHGGRVRFQVLNALAAAGAAWCLGIPCEAIRAGLETFGGDLAKAPGRFNLFKINGATIVLDYGHNAAALSNVIEAVRQFPHRRRSVVYSAAGDRRDCDLVRQGEMLGEAFDHVILYEDHYLRGRKEGEIIGLFRQGVERGRRVSKIEEVRGALKSVETALAGVHPGELLVIQPDVIDETVDFLQHYLTPEAGGREISLAEALAVADAEPVFASSPRRGHAVESGVWGEGRFAARMDVGGSVPDNAPIGAERLPAWKAAAPGVVAQGDAR